jgi:UrcA family protein
MRFPVLLIAGLLGACIAVPPQPAIGLSYGDLRLESRDGRAALRQRVVQAARDYCAEYGAETTPHAARADPVYCLDMFRSWIVGEMPPAVRRAYFQARREAGVRGRQL